VDHDPRAPFNEVLLSVETSPSFGGVKAFSDISFDIAKGEVRAIIGPQRAGKSSMLTASTASTSAAGRHPLQGRARSQMRPHEAPSRMARTFQNNRAVSGMSTLETS